MGNAESQPQFQNQNQNQQQIRRKLVQGQRRPVEVKQRRPNPSQKYNQYMRHQQQEERPPVRIQRSTTLAQQQEQYVKNQYQQAQQQRNPNTALHQQLESMQQQMNNLQQQISSQQFTPISREMDINQRPYNGEYNSDIERMGNNPPSVNQIVKQYDFGNVSILNVNDKIKEYETHEQKQEREFREEQTRRQKQFEEQKRKNRDIFEREIQMFEQSQDDPYKILGLDKYNINVDKIKKAYKMKAYRNHPDRGGSPELFKKITQSYMYLLNKYEQEDEYKWKTQQEVIKKEYDANTSVNKGYQNVHISKDNFNLNKFNQVFEDYRMQNAFDDGYGNIMTNDKRTDEKIEVKSIFSNQNFNKDIFNQAFADEKDNSYGHDEVIVYDEPEALPSNGGSFQELGQTRISDFTGGRGVDYKRAYGKDSKFINPDSVKYREYKNLNELKSERSNISHQMNPEDKRKYEQRKIREAAREKRRQETQRDIDNRYMEQFEKLNQLFIKDY